MEYKRRSRTLFVILSILFLLFAPSWQKSGSAQEDKLIPGGLGKPPEIGVAGGPHQDQDNESLDSVEANFSAFLPLAVDPSAPTTTSPCGAIAKEKTLANLAKTHPDQGRPVMTCHPILTEVAHERAMDMGKNGYFSHTNPDGYGPNFLVEEAGYQLPSWWPDSPDENYIESIAGGYATADAAWNAWLKSQAHRKHVLGEVDFWAEQTNYGMGYAYIPGSPYGHYWVFITAPPQGK